MAVDQAHTGFGAIISKDDGFGNFIPVLGVKSISGPSMSREIHDTTDMNNPSNYRTKIGGLVDGGELTFEANWLPRAPGQNQDEGGLWAEFDKSSCASLGSWRVDIPDCPGEPAAYILLDGIFSGMGAEIPMDDIMSFQGTITVSGRPELVIEES